MAIVAALLYGFWPRPLWVEAATVARQSLRVTVEAEGKTRIMDRYVLSAPVAGALRRIGRDVGDAIRQGQPLATMDPLPSEVLDPPRRDAQTVKRFRRAAARYRAGADRRP